MKETLRNLLEIKEGRTTKEEASHYQFASVEEKNTCINDIEVKASVFEQEMLSSFEKSEINIIKLGEFFHLNLFKI